MAGSIGTLAHYLLLVLLVEAAGADAVAASGSGFLAGAIVNYLLNRHYTFRSGRRHREALPRFLAVASGTMLLNMLIMYILHSIVGAHYLVAQIAATAGALFVNFGINRRWTFGAQRR
jgi:putative flippase GtrA